MDCKWWVYVVRCSDGSLYSGVTTDPERRVHEHNCCKHGAKYTRSRRPVELVFKVERSYRNDALCREYELKQMPKQEKEEFVSNVDLGWAAEVDTWLQWGKVTRKVTEKVKSVPEIEPASAASPGELHRLVGQETGLGAAQGINPHTNVYGEDVRKIANEALELAKEAERRFVEKDDILEDIIMALLQIARAAAPGYNGWSPRLRAYFLRKKVKFDAAPATLDLLPAPMGTTTRMEEVKGEEKKEGG